MTLRTEQKEQRRELIIFKSTELFAKNGYADTKISDIADALDMSIGLLFHYFESKEKLFEELVRLGVELAAQPKRFDTDNPLDYFRRSLSGIFKAAEKNPFVLHMFVLMNQARYGDNIPQHIRELALSVDQINYSARIIKKGQQLGYFRAGDAHLLSFTFWSAVQGIMEQIAVTPKDIAFPDPEWLIGIIKT